MKVRAFGNPAQTVCQQHAPDGKGFLSESGLLASTVPISHPPSDLSGLAVFEAESHEHVSDLHPKTASAGLKACSGSQGSQMLKASSLREIQKHQSNRKTFSFGQFLER